MLNIKELKERFSHKLFLNNLLENKFQTTKMTRKTREKRTKKMREKKGFSVVNIKYIVTGTTKAQGRSKRDGTVCHTHTL